MGNGIASDRWRLVVATAVGTAALLVPATLAGAASAATLSVNAACYVITKKVPPMAVAGTGFTPGDSVSVTSADGSVDTTATADATGNIAVTTNAPTLSFTTPGAKSATLTATDDTTGTITATVPVEVAPLGFSHGSTKKAPGLRALTETTNWAFSGFTPGKTIYAHYTIKGKQVARQAFGKASGPCGVLKTRKALYPATPHTKSYPLQVDSVKKYSSKTLIKVTGRVSLELEF